MSLPSLESLRLFCDVVRQKSFSRAAALNHVSQSAVSQTVSQIEKRLAVRLIDRSRRPPTVTSEGQFYYAECRDLVDRYIAIEARLRKKSHSEPSRIDVAAIYSIVLYDMDQYIQEVIRNYPQCQVRFHYLHPDDVHNSVLNERADLGLLSFPRSARELEVIPWCDEPMVLVCPPTHRLARRKQVSVKELKGEAFVAFENGLAVRRAVDRFFRENSVEVRVVMAFDNIEFIKRGIETGAGFSILPEPTVRREVEGGSLQIVRVTELDLTRPLCIIHRRRRLAAPAMSALIDALCGVQLEEVISGPTDTRTNKKRGKSSAGDDSSGNR
jgi:DNA-binding transcriptional LysR family regulator